MTENITLPVDLARELTYSRVGRTYEGWTVVADEYVKSGRWEGLRDLVIRRDSDGALFAGPYRQGLTENQDARLRESEAEAVFEYVVPVERTITVIDYITPEAAQALAEQQDGAR